MNSLFTTYPAVLTTVVYENRHYVICDVYSDETTYVALYTFVLVIFFAHMQLGQLPMGLDFTLAFSILNYLYKIPMFFFVKGIKIHFHA